MKLMYRGVEYNYEPVPVDMSETGIPGQYRGQAFTFVYPRHVPTSQPVGDYKYRGVSYHRTENGSVEAITPTRELHRIASEVAPNVATSTAVAPTAEVISGMTYRSVAASRKALLQEIAGKHHDNIQRRLQHRSEVAKAKGDQLLISQLEREMQYITH